MIFAYDMDMDNIFKEIYTTYMVKLLPRVETSWAFQLLYLHHIWENVGDFIQQREFFNDFAMGCDKYGLPADLYNIDDAFNVANNEWKPELMERVSNLRKQNI